jgi:hypothetical protein
MREDRLVLPIPPGMHWSDEMPVMRPAATAAPTARALPGKTQPQRVVGSKSGPQLPTTKQRAPVQFGVPGAPKQTLEEPVAPKEEKPVKPKREKIKADPALVAKARELRDRWLEHVNAGQASIESAGKYDVVRVLPAINAVESPATVPQAMLALPEAA